MINEATLFPKGVSNLWGKQLQRRKLGLTPASGMGWWKVPSFQPAGAFEDLGTAPFPPLTLWAPQPRGTARSVEIKRLATQTCRGDQNLFPVVL